MKNGYSIDIHLRDWLGGRSFGIEKDDVNDISLGIFARFCYDAGIAYGFTTSQMDQIINGDGLEDF